MSAGEVITERAEPADHAEPRRWLILATCCSSILIVGLDVTVVNVALPSIQRDLDASVAGIQWTVDAYTLVIASLLMLAGSLGDRIGRRRTFQAGLIIFCAASCLCGLAPSLGVLLAGRVLQAVGGAMLNPVAMSIVRNVFTDGKERAQAIGVWGAVFGLSMALGPVLGGALVSAYGWRSIFFINIPIGIAALVLTGLVVPESRAEKPRQVDSLGQLLVIIGLATLTYAIIEGPRAGWGTPEIVGAFVAALLCFALLVVYELHHPEPLLDMRFFHSAPFSGATAMAVLTLASFGGFLFLSTLYLQSDRGLSPLTAGACMLPAAALTIVSSPIAGRLVANGRSRLPLLISATAMGVGALMLTRLTSHTPMTYLLGAFMLFGVGEGMSTAPITNAAVTGMPSSQAGVASAVASTSRQVGTTLGVALVGAVSGGTAGAISNRFAYATHSSWWILLGIQATVVVLALVSTSRWATRQAGPHAGATDPGDRDVPGRSALSIEVRNAEGIALISAPSNLGLRPPAPGAVPGTAKAPEALREAGLLEAFTRRGAVEAGVVLPGRYLDDPNPAGRRLRNHDGILDHAQRLADCVDVTLDRGRSPLILGGDCSILLGPALALRRRGRFGLIHIDGHTDFRHPGNSDTCSALAGEDLAAAVGLHWPSVADIDGFGPYFRPTDTVHIGCRDDDEHLDEVRSLLGAVIPASAVRASPASAARTALGAVSGAEGFWLHLDVDVLDPSVMPAVDSPAPGGLTTDELTELLTVLSPYALGAQVTVFDPDLDPDGALAERLTTVILDGLSDLGTHHSPHE